MIILMSLLFLFIFCTFMLKYTMYAQLKTESPAKEITSSKWMCEKYEVHTFEQKLADAGGIAQDDVTLCDNESCELCSHQRKRRIRVEEYFTKRLELGGHLLMVSSSEYPAEVHFYTHSEDIVSGDGYNLRMWSWTDPRTGKTKQLITPSFETAKFLSMVSRPPLSITTGGINGGTIRTGS